jgi:hypothetical protein
VTTPELIEQTSDDVLSIVNVTVNKESEVAIGVYPVEPTRGLLGASEEKLMVWSVWMLYVPVVALGEPVSAAVLGDTTETVKVILWDPVPSEILKLLKVATPVADVITEVFPLTLPEPESMVAVTVYSPADAFVVVSVLLYLSCKVTIGGGSNLTAMNSSNA